MLLKQKKGQYLLWGWLIGVIVVLGTMFYLSQQVYEGDAYIGDDALAILEGSESFQRTLNQLDLLADASFDEFIELHASNNFLSDSDDCEYLINPIYTEECKPELEGLESEVETRFSALEQRVSREVTIQDINVEFEDEHIVYQSPEDSLEQFIYTSPQRHLVQQTIDETPLGDPLVSLETVPNVDCVEGDTCQAVPELKDNLERMSEEYLQPNNLDVIITSSFRSRAEQLRLLERAGGDTTYACDPRRSVCNHMTGMAIDLNILYNNINLNNFRSGEEQEESRNRVRKALCEYGFVNYWVEHWHYEYKSNQWENVRKDNPEGCAYGGGEDIDWSEVKIWKEVNGELEPQEI